VLCRDWEVMNIARLAGMNGAGPLGGRWILAAVATVAPQQLRVGGNLSVANLGAFLAVAELSSRSRRFSCDLIASVHESVEQRLIPGLLNDFSFELRQAGELKAQGDEQQALAAYLAALTASSVHDQIQTAVKELRGLGTVVNLVSFLGFVTAWRGAHDCQDRRLFSS